MYRIKIRKYYVSLVSKGWLKDPCGVWAVWPKTNCPGLSSVQLLSIYNIHCSHLNPWLLFAAKLSSTQVPTLQTPGVWHPPSRGVFSQLAPLKPGRHRQSYPDSEFSSEIAHQFWFISQQDTSFETLIYQLTLADATVLTRIDGAGFTTGHSNLVRN